MNMWAIFITGLTTGGLSCLAMQGGLLASVIANQKDQELETTPKKHPSISPKSFDQLDWLPVSMFLIGKLSSHTIIGFFLGYLGSQLELSLTTRLLFQGLAAFFMFVTAMNLLDVHPIFRYVVIQPPKFFTRLIRNTTKSKAVFTPLLLGFLTLLIPCGTTQSMEVLAITSGNPVIGAVTMFLFVLGTLPLFGLLGLGIAKLSELWTSTFMNIAALSLVFLSLSSLNGILVVLDSPITFQKIKIALLDPAHVVYSSSQSSAQLINGTQHLTLHITNSGYVPNHLSVKAGIPVNLTLQTLDVYSCASDFIFPEFNLKARLQANDTKNLSFTPTRKGKFTFTCSMGMYTGTLEVY